jgi:nitrite reductase (NADH) large subunit
MTSVGLSNVAGRPLWRTAQGAGLVLTIALIGALNAWPTATLHLLWDTVIPVLPAVFLINPLLWRNVCPLATANEIGGTWRGARTVGTDAIRPLWLTGIVLLFVLVPARRFVFNTNGPALAITVSLVKALALAAGMFYSRRAGFCNAICPVLPVEKLYGQSPLVELGSARCRDCTLCTPVGCIDLAASKTIAQTIGPHRRDTGWLRTSFGAFAAAFPGFIIGYFTVENSGLGAAAAVYWHVAAWSVGSYAVVAAVVAALRVRASVAMPALSVGAIGLYYWFAAPAIMTSWSAPASYAGALRTLAALLLLAWVGTVGWRARQVVAVSRS